MSDLKLVLGHGGQNMRQLGERLFLQLLRDINYFMVVNVGS